MSMSSLVRSRAGKRVIATAAAAAVAGLIAVPHAFALEVGINKVGETIQLGTQDIRTTVARIINVAMGLLGIVAVVIILAGGFMWMTAGGNEDKVGEAKKLIFAGIIGLAIILSAFAIANFVVTSLVNATSN